MEQLRQVRFTDASLTATAGANSTIIRAGRTYVVTTTIVDSNFINGTARTKTITVRVTPWSDSSPWARNVDTVFGSVTMVSERTSYILGPNRAF
jgi:hypothetical protein